MISLGRMLSLRPIIWQLTLRELQGRYVGSAMGLFWSVVNPLMTLLIWTFVFSYVLDIRFSAEGGLGNFALYLFAGMVPFLAFQETVQNCTVSVTRHAALIKNLVFPSKAIQLSIAVAALVTEFIALGILAVAIMVFKQQLPIYLGLALPLALILMLFSLGLGYITCTLHVFFRDTAQLVGVLLMIWLYATPIFYPAHLLPANLQFLIYINPLAYTANVFRSLLLLGELPSLTGFLLFSGISAGTFLMGYSVYTRYYHTFIDEL
ncbi:MAG: ABC transporter permease [Acidobacteriota bacterium]